MQQKILITMVLMIMVFNTKLFGEIGQGYSPIKPLTTLIELTLVSPNGGENFYYGSTDTIKWTSANIANVKLEYTTNNGANWTTIIASTPAIAQSYLWLIPNTLSNQCRVRVINLENLLQSDASELTFSIIKVNAPKIVSFTFKNDYFAKDIQFDYILTDLDPNDTLALRLYYNVGGGWKEGKLNDELRKITPNNYSGAGRWISYNDLKGINKNVSINIIVLDKFGVTDTIIKAIDSLINLTGDIDYSEKSRVGVEFYDIAPFIDAWKTTGQIDNIGPTSGVPPNLVPSTLPEEQIINFEDMGIFSVMWHWTAANLNMTENNILDLSKANNTGTISFDVIKKESGSSLAITTNEKIRGIKILLEYPAGSHKNIKAFSGNGEGSSVIFSTPKSYGFEVNIVKWEKSNFLPGEEVCKLEFDRQTVPLQNILLKYETIDSLNKKSFTGTESIFFNETQEYPNKYELFQNYPNPFNMSTNLSYSIAEDGFVQIRLFDILGNEVAVIVDKFQAAGHYSLNISAEHLTTGVYLCKLNSSDHVSTIKLILLK